MHKKVKLRLLILLGICIYIPFISFSIATEFSAGIVTYTVCFLLYGYFVYHLVQKGQKPKYPMVPPEGRADIYCPRTNIPRPIYEDVRRYPDFFGRKKERYRRTRRVKKKS